MNEEELTEEQIEDLIDSNNVLLEEFERWLLCSGLKQKTSDTHVSNIEFFLNDYLVPYEGVPPEEGTADVCFFMSWFIRKAMWASKASLKNNGASFKKFYAFLCEKELIEPYQLEELRQIIKLGMPDWLEELERFDNLTFDDFY